MADEITLEELAEMSGISLRTIRFYIQEGLLAGPDTRGKYARYSKKHLQQLLVIQGLKDLHMPLQEIRQLMETLSLEELQRKVDKQAKMKPSYSRNIITERESQEKLKERSSALDYIHSLEDLQGNLGRSRENSIRLNSPAPLVKLMQMAEPEQPEDISGSWRRMELTQGVELHFKESLNQKDRQAVEELLTHARHLFAKNKKGD